MTTIPVLHIDPQDAAVACTLPPEVYRDRAADLSSLAQDALLAREPIHSGERLTFTDTPRIEERLRAAIAAEASCCSFLTMRLDRAADRLVLDVTGPAHSAPIIAELFA